MCCVRDLLTPVSADVRVVLGPRQCLVNEASTAVSAIAHCPGTHNHHCPFTIGRWTDFIRFSYLSLSVQNMSCPSVEAGFPNPREFETAGWYPRNYRVSFDATTQRFTVAMTQLQWRQSYQSKLDELSQVCCESFLCVFRSMCVLLFLYVYCRLPCIAILCADGNC